MQRKINDMRVRVCERKREREEVTLMNTKIDEG